MNAVKYFILDLIIKCKISRLVYLRLRKHKMKSMFKIEDILNINPLFNDKNNSTRLNLVLPTLRKTGVFGGVLTAIRIFEMLIRSCGCPARIIVLSDEKYSKISTYHVNGFSCDETVQNQILYFSSTRSVEINENDILIFTSWRTAYSFIPILNGQMKHFNLKYRKAIYLIQDYEPCFNAWSATYALAESTYRTCPNKIIALYNSRELYDYFHLKDFSFFKELYFEPTLNENLKKYLLERKECNRKKQILIYGRPSVPRNAYEIIKGALQIWSRNYKGAKDWRIISLGEYFENEKLGNNTLEVLGKVSLKEYADIMLDSYAGISLMISPHPSYPPLEMSTFGVRTITNSFENKDLSYFSKNIISVSSCTPKEIAVQLEIVCEEYNKVSTIIDLDSPYISGHQFETVIEQLGVTIDEMVNDDKSKG